jgi:hypothetical protein
VLAKDPEPRARRQAARRVIDWQKAARLLDQGMPIAAAAAQIGCSPATLARRRRHDPAFQSPPSDPVPTATDAIAPPDRRHLHPLIEHEMRGGNLRVALWLGQRVKLTTPPGPTTPAAELQALLDGLTADELREFERLRDDL